MLFICYMAAEAPSETVSDRLMSSWARQRLVAASSRRTEEKVASRRGSGRHCRRASRARLLSLRLQQLLENITKRRGHSRGLTEGNSAQRALAGGRSAAPPAE